MSISLDTNYDDLLTGRLARLERRMSDRDREPSQPTINILGGKPNGNGNGSWKTSPVTLGLLVALVAGSVTLGNWILRGESGVRAIAAEAVGRHCEQDVDRAHTDLPRKYVPRTEVQESLHGITRALERLADSQKQVIQRLDEPPRALRLR
jgi:hypothetical protein